MTWSIFVRERRAKKEIELCCVETNPESLVAAAQSKRLLVDSGNGCRKISVPKYEHVYAKKVK